jgi:hypothetical protein
LSSEATVYNRILSHQGDLVQVCDGDVGVLTGRNHAERLIAIHSYAGIGRDARDQRRIPADRSIRTEVEGPDDIGLFTE